jgi:glutathionylspermidine synthase
MNLPYQLGAPVDRGEWEHLKLRAVFDCCKWDIQSEDHCVLTDFPLLLKPSAWEYLSKAAEALTAEAISAEAEILFRPELHAGLGVVRQIRAELAHVEGPSSSVARTMRFDFHFTEDGWRISEVNADVPGGFVEAGGFTQLMWAHFRETTAPPNPADVCADAIAKSCGDNAVVAMVHATAYKDDREVMQYLAKRMVSRGARVIFASPAHVMWNSGAATISSAFARGQIDAIVRFYPAEWLPIIRDKRHWAAYFGNSRTPISNPASALLVQSKRFPLVWDKLRTDVSTWRILLPESRCPGEFQGWNSDEWVLKPAFGRVGEDLGIPGITPVRALERIYNAARRHPSEWVAQRRFWAVPSRGRSGAFYPSIGVYTVNGRTAGAYGRIARKPLIDGGAQDIAVLISERGTA